MERELGFSLLERQKRKFKLTSAGDFFYKKSLVLAADYEQIVREATRLAGGEQECLKVGFLRCYSGQEFYLALEEFAEKETEAEYYRTIYNTCIEQAKKDMQSDVRPEVVAMPENMYRVMISKDMDNHAKIKISI